MASCGQGSQTTQQSNLSFSYLFGSQGKTSSNSNQKGQLASFVVLLALAVSLVSLAKLWLPMSACTEEVSLVVLLLAVGVWGTTFGWGKPQKPLKPLKSSGPSPTPAKVRSTAGPPAHAAEPSNSLGGQLHAAAKAGDLDAAETLAEKMKATGCTLSVVSYGTLINAYAKAGKVQGAERWLHELNNSGLGKPNVICVNSTISACAKGGQVRKAEAWLECMPEMV